MDQTQNLRRPTGRRNGKGFAYGAGGHGFDFQAGSSEHGVANG